MENHLIGKAVIRHGSDERDFIIRLGDAFNSGKVYEAVGDVRGEQSCERLIFSGLRFEDMDPVTGTVTLEVTDLELIRKMITM